MKLQSWFVIVSATLVGAIALTSCASNPPATVAVPTPQTASAQVEAATPDVPFVPTPQVVVDRMLQLAQVGSEDVVYDLGSGDGRLVITAVDQFQADRGVGIEIQPRLIAKATDNAQQEGVSDRAIFRQADLFETDFSNASVVTLYLLPEINMELRPRLLQELEPGTRVVSHDFDMGDWEPDEVVQVQGPTRMHTLYKWTVPEEIPAHLQS